MLTIIQLLTLPLSLELNSGPREQHASRTAKRQPLVAVAGASSSPTCETFSDNNYNNLASIQCLQAIKTHPICIDSSSESLQSKHHTTSNQSHLRGLVSRVCKNVASYDRTIASAQASTRSCNSNNTLLCVVASSQPLQDSDRRHVLHAFACT
jgi:hypothetical protein